MNNNYIPKFILDNNELFQKINENIETKKYDELTINLRNLISLSQEPSDLLDIHYVVMSNKKNCAVVVKILGTEFKKSPLFNEVDKIKDNIDIEHKNYLLNMLHDKLKLDNKKLKTRIFIMIPVTLLVFLMAYVSNGYYMWGMFVVCIASFPTMIKRVKFNNKMIKSNVI